MKSFRFQQFTVTQNKDVFRVGTDAMLLGALSFVDAAHSIVEIGTGTGVISLMLAQRNTNAEIIGLDIDENAFQLTQENFNNSPFHERLTAFHQDYKEWSANQKFDLIVSNPPYFEVHTHSEKDRIARQQIELNFQELIEKSAELVSENGVFSVIIPKSSEESFVNISLENKLYLIRKINIFGLINGKAKRVILEFSLAPKNIVEENFIIEKSPRVYSEQYLQATEAFHVFKN